MSNQTLASELKTDPRARVIETRARAGKVMRPLCPPLLLPILLLGTGCAPTTTLFKSSFDPTPVNQLPAHNQAVGTVTVDGGVRVAAVPDANAKGVKFDHIDGANVAVLHCDLAQHPGDGTYVFSTALYFPSGSGGLATIQFERAGGGERFLHLDFPGTRTEGHVRIDDDESTTFGTFPRNQLIIVQVTLNIAPSSANAQIALGGAGASGNATRSISPALLPIARQFGAVSVASNLAADDSTFFATNIVVTHKP